MPRISKGDIIKAGVILAGGSNRNFTDLDLSEYLDCGLKEIRKFKIKEFVETNLWKIKCPFCGYENPISQDIDFIFCRSCKKKIDKFPRKEFNLNYEKVLNFLKEEFLSKLEDYKLIKQERNKLFVGYRDYTIGAILSVEKIKLENFYSLCGWCKNEEPDFYVLIGYSFDPLLLSQDMKTNIVIFSIKDFFESKKLEKIDIFIEHIKELEPLGIKEIKYDLKEILKEWKTIKEKLSIYALQQEGNKGYTFQEMVIKLLKHIFPIIPKGGKNQPDALIPILYTQGKRSILVPVEIKSYKPKDFKKPYFSLKEHSLQIRKYINAFHITEITSKYDVPSMLLIAYDFDINNKDEVKIRKQLERDYNVKIVMMPLKSLIKLCNLTFLNKMTGLWYNEDYEKLLLSQEYITPEYVENLLKEIEKRTKEFEKYSLKQVSKKIKSWGKGG